jgi:hypothetical protein
MRKKADDGQEAEAKPPKETKPPKEAKLVSITEIANRLDISAKTARAKLRRKIGKQRWAWPAGPAVKQVEKFLTGKADTPIIQ